MAYTPPALSASDLPALQLERLQWTVHHAYHNSAFYRDKLDAAGLRPGAIKTLADLERLPFTTKDDLRSAGPFGVLAVPEEQVLRVHASSGTTGRRTVASYTRKDLDDWADMMARCMQYAGLGERDRVQITAGYGLWTAGVGFQAGVERLGALAVPVGPIGTDTQIELLVQMQSTAVCATSSFALLLGEEVARRGIADQLRLRVGIFGSERWGEAMRQRIRDLLRIDVYDIIGMTETYGPGTGLDCHLHQGIHYWGDYLIFEIIDPQTGAVLPAGEQGELVVTTLQRESMPLLRYRTRDLTRLIPGACPCGSPFGRIDRIVGRSDDAIKYRGVLFYPADIDGVLAETPGVCSEYRIVLSRPGGRDHCVVRIEADPQSGEDRAAVALEVQRRLRDRLRATMAIEIVDFGALPRTERKTARVIDERD